MEGLLSAKNFAKANSDQKKKGNYTVDVYLKL